MTQHCKFPINTDLPLKVPYRTGSYLIYDYQPEQETKKRSDCPEPLATHFREGTEIGLRASGSRQLNFDLYSSVLKTVAALPQVRKLCVVDLRQESHLFFDNLAVSWYADKDWSNVGQSLDWILKDEACRIDMSRGKTVQVFSTSKNPADDTIIPTGYSEMEVKSALSEEEVVQHIAATLPHSVGHDRIPVVYERIPVTDHCMPTPDAVNTFLDLILSLKPEQTWIHFHCHGGDGRTTTFMAMYDMFCKAQSDLANFPSIGKFAKRQMSLFCYDLNAENSPCDEDTNWKCALVKARWAFLTVWHDWLKAGALRSGKPLAHIEAI